MVAPNISQRPNYYRTRVPRVSQGDERTLNVGGKQRRGYKATAALDLADEEEEKERHPHMSKLSGVQEHFVEKVAKRINARSIDVNKHRARNAAIGGSIGALIGAAHGHLHASESHVSPRAVRTVTGVGALGGGVLGGILGERFRTYKQRHHDTAAVEDLRKLRKAGLGKRYAGVRIPESSDSRSIRNRFVIGAAGGGLTGAAAGHLLGGGTEGKAYLGAIGSAIGASAGLASSARKRLRGEQEAGRHIRAINEKHDMKKTSGKKMRAALIGAAAGGALGKGIAHYPFSKGYREKADQSYANIILDGGLPKSRRAFYRDALNKLVSAKSHRASNYAGLAGAGIGAGVGALGQLVAERRAARREAQMKKQSGAISNILAETLIGSAGGGLVGAGAGHLAGKGYTRYKLRGAKSRMRSAGTLTPRKERIMNSFLAPSSRYASARMRRKGAEYGSVIGGVGLGGAQAVREIRAALARRRARLAVGKNAA